MARKLLKTKKEILKVLELFEELIDKEKKQFFQTATTLMENALKSTSDEPTLNGIEQDLEEEIQEFYNNLDQQKKSDFTEKLRNISPRFLKVLEPEKSIPIVIPKLTREEKIYWKEIKFLLETVLQKKDMNSVVDDNLKKKILQKIESSIHEKNYLISKLIIYEKVDEENLLNFLFLNAVNKYKFYYLYQFYPDKYGMLFTFNLHPSQLPNLRLILNESEYSNLLNDLNINYLVEEIKNADKEILKRIFPKSYKYFNTINPFL